MTRRALGHLGWLLGAALAAACREHQPRSPCPWVPSIPAFLVPLLLPAGDRPASKAPAPLLVLLARRGTKPGRIVYSWLVQSPWKGALG